MNNTFNLTRFGQLLKKDLFENWKKYTLQTLTLFSIILVSFIFQSFNKYNVQGEAYMIKDGYRIINQELVIISFIIFLGGYAIFLSQMMDSLRSKQKRTQYLTFPCSNLEKYLSKITIHALGFIVLFLVAMYLADLIRVIIYSIPADNIEVKSITLTGNIFNRLNNTPYVLLYAIYLFLLSLYALGSTFWQRNGFVKTTVALGVVIVIGFIIIYGVASALFTPGMYFNTPEFSQETYQKLYYLAIALVLTSTLFIYVLSYYRFKEAELIERW